jgi:hypothetical protein
VIRKLIGGLLLGSPFIVATIVMVSYKGWATAAMMWGAVLALLGAVAIGLALLGGEK